ncbi:MAG TPA: MFS transporter [Conexivisphaerales archaeon]|nr:MFS transporter [Conexivisphaerales archaeon]
MLGGRSRLFFLDSSVFLSSLGLGLTAYFIPTYIRSVGGSMLDVGLAGSAKSILYAFLPFFFGYVSDRGIRRQLYLFGIFVNLATTAMLVFAKTVPLVILTQVLASVGYSLLWPITEAMVAESVEPDRRVSAMAWYSVSWAMGFFLGPAIGGPIQTWGGYGFLFTAATVVLAFTIAYTLLTLRRSYRPLAVPSGPKLVLPSRALSPAYAAVLAYGIIFGIIVSMFPAYLNAYGFDVSTIGYLFALFALVRVFAFFTDDTLSRRIPKWALYLSVAFMFAGCSLVGVFGFTSLIWMVALLLISGYGFGVFYPVTLVLVSNEARSEGLGAAVGALEAFYGMGVVVGPLAGGYLSSVSLSTPYLFCCAVALTIPAFIALQGWALSRRR